MRLDQYCALQLSTRSKAKDAIKEGRVRVNDTIIKKPSFLVNENDSIVIEDGDGYVSRAAYKLLGAIDTFHIDLEKQVVLDIGASTGGFTQVSIQHGASKVYALDVGHSQLDQSLIHDPKVVVMEKRNARQLESSWFDESIDFICMDVSFISCLPILEQIFSQLKPKHMVILIKPQFEVGPQYVNKKGIVTSQKRVNEVLDKIQVYTQQFYQDVNIVPAKIAGRKGNQEYTMYAKERR